MKEKWNDDDDEQRSESAEWRGREGRMEECERCKARAKRRMISG
jgi:hypothetical protein